ncbi:MAG: CoA ester lyase [Pseudomonadota bacterium]
MSADIRPRRSVLYMPGSNARALEKAKTLAADSLILDLEDAVAPDMKEVAREQVRNAVIAGGFGHREIIIRVNGLGTPWGEADLDAAIMAAPDAILIPKVDDPKALEDINARLGDAKSALWAMIETPKAILNIGEIAAIAEKGIPLKAFVLGTNDLAKETGARLTPGRPAFAAWLSMTVITARAYGVTVIDGVYNDFNDLDGFNAECIEGRDLGMDGKTLIHPKQIDIANDAFAPADAEVEFARKIITAFNEPENAGKGAITIDGRMVELLHRDMALKTVAIADAISAADDVAAGEAA